MPRMPFAALALAAALVLLPAPLAAQGDLVIRPSKNSGKDTIDKLAKAIEAAGLKVVARVDHAAAAKASGAELPATELLMFGNPKLGTPLMQAKRTIGIELPLKALAWIDNKGQVWLATTSPDDLKRRYGIKGQDETFKAMKAALDKLAEAAIQAN